MKSLSSFTVQVEYLSKADNFKLILQEAITTCVHTLGKSWLPRETFHTSCNVKTTLSTHSKVANMNGSKNLHLFLKNQALVNIVYCT
jgi:hypothetical protein